MFDENKLLKLMETCCDVMNLAAALDININAELEAATRKILTVAHERSSADLANLRAALRPRSTAVQ